MRYVIWGLLLIAQNFAHTISQRAKNQNNLWYTGVSGVFANGIWIGSNFFIVDEVVSVLRGSNVGFDAMKVITFYIICTTFGTVFSQYCAMRWIEKWIERRS